MPYGLFRAAHSYNPAQYSDIILIIFGRVIKS